MPSCYSPPFSPPSQQEKQRARVHPALAIPSLYLPWLSSAAESAMARHRSSLSYPLAIAVLALAVVLEIRVLGLSCCVLRCTARFTSGLADAWTHRCLAIGGVLAGSPPPPPRGPV
jgi:hypothetical protein